MKRQSRIGVDHAAHSAVLYYGNCTMVSLSTKGLVTHITPVGKRA
jgi:hypothetical protein